MVKVMEVKKCIVNENSLFREIANNTTNYKEILREAISNSIDARSERIQILLGIDEDTGLFTVTIEDEGDGMQPEDFESFFGLGSSRKDKNTIGNKGLGTKTFFKCSRLIVESQCNGGKHRAVLDQPWNKILEAKPLEYEIEQIEKTHDRNGTKITIVGYCVSHPSESYFSFREVSDYIKWFTAAGSFKSKFTQVKELRKKIKQMTVTPLIRVEDTISGQTEEFVGEHKFSEPNENPISDTNIKRSDEYCRHFGPFHRSTHIEGVGYVSYQIYGTVSGYNQRKAITEFGKGGKHKSRFGFILCKDFVYIQNTKDELLGDGNYNHYHVMINSQNFELTADRNNLSNMDSEEVQWILKSAKELINREIYEVAQKTYFALRKEESDEEALIKKIDEMKERLSSYHKLECINLPNFPKMKVPRSEAQVIVILATLIAKGYLEDYFIGEYSGSSATDIILEESNGRVLLAEVEYQLSNLFKHKHPLDSFDLVICWKVDLMLNETRELNGQYLTLVATPDGYQLNYGVNKSIKVIELASLIASSNTINMLEMSSQKGA